MRNWLMTGAACLLAACGGDKPAGEAVAGGGEVLEGTASDAMLPLATVTSEPPPAPPEPAATTRASGAAEAAATPEPAGTAAATPAALPEADTAAE